MAKIALDVFCRGERERGGGEKRQEETGKRKKKGERER